MIEKNHFYKNYLGNDLLKKFHVHINNNYASQTPFSSFMLLDELKVKLIKQVLITLFQTYSTKLQLKQNLDATLFSRKRNKQ